MSRALGLLAATMLFGAFAAACADTPDPEMDYTSRYNPPDAGGAAADAGNRAGDGGRAGDAGPSKDGGRSTDGGPSTDGGHAGDAGGGPPADHTLDLGGFAHRNGNTDPLKNCVSCHGAKLAGGVGRSCYSCHNTSDHPVDHGGKKHRPEANNTCNACHGPNNTGGLGKACSTCHPGEPGSGPPADHNVKLGNIAHRSGQTDPRKNCVSCHGANLRGGTGKSCYGSSCHNTNGHNVNQDGRKHMDRSVNCSRCHGPNNSGGIGQACASAGCHPGGVDD